jgi:hypothetical protein
MNVKRLLKENTGKNVKEIQIKNSLGIPLKSFGSFY